MALAQAKTLTPEQEALIPAYRAKWRRMTLSTESINPTIAKEVLGNLYGKLGLPQPKFLFFDSPYSALSSGRLDWAGNSVRYQLESLLENLLWSLLSQELPPNDLDDRLWRLTGSQLASHLGFLLRSQLEDQLTNYPQKQIWNYLDNCLQPQLWQDCHGSWFDYFISVLNYSHNAQKWELLQTLGRHCGWVFPGDNLCIICARPTKLLLDSNDLFHAEGEPAIQFADGFGVYAYHGVRLPQKYGKLLHSCIG